MDRFMEKWMDIGTDLWTYTDASIIQSGKRVKWSSPHFFAVGFLNGTNIKLVFHLGLKLVYFEPQFQSNAY